MACGSFDWSCQAAQGISGWATTAADKTLDGLADAIGQSVGQVLSALGSLWVDLPTSNLTGGSATAASERPPGAKSFDEIVHWSAWLGAIVCVLSVIAFCGWLIWQRSDVGEMNNRLGVLAAACILLSGSTSLVGFLLEGTSSPSSTTVAFIQSSLSYYVAGMAVISVIIAAIKMSWEQRSHPAKELLRSLLTLVLVSGFGLAALQLAVTASDAFASWVIDQATGGQTFGENLTKLVAVSSGATGGLGAIIVILLGFVALLASLIQIALMIVRGAMLVLLGGVLPLSASFTNTPIGKAWFQKTVGWLVAFVLYKPAAALVYATAFKLIGTKVTISDPTGIVGIITGVVLMIMALLALPALMRFMIPIVGGSTSNIGPGGAVSGVLNLAAPTGAIVGTMHSRSRVGSPGQGSGTSKTGPEGATALGSRATSSAGSGAAAKSATAKSVGGAAAGASGAAAAAGPVGMTVVGAQKVGEGGRKVADGMKSAVDDSSGGEGPS